MFEIWRFYPFDIFLSWSWSIYDDGEEKITAIDAGADEYIQWPDTIQESVASARALIRPYTELNRQNDVWRTILSRGSIFDQRGLSQSVCQCTGNTAPAPWVRFVLSAGGQSWPGIYTGTALSADLGLRLRSNGKQSALLPSQDTKKTGSCKSTLFHSEHARCWLLFPARRYIKRQ